MYPLRLMNQKSSQYERFGKQISVKRNSFRGPHGEGNYQILSGWIAVVMVMERDVPSYLMIDGVRAIIRYQGQPQTCRIYNNLDHFCPRNSRPRNRETVNTIPGNSWELSTIKPSTTVDQQNKNKKATQKVVNELYTKDFPPTRVKERRNKRR